MICKNCDIEKLKIDFKKGSLVCKKCHSSINYEKYKYKFKIYYERDQQHRLEYQKEKYLEKKKLREANNDITKTRGRPRKINLEINEQCI